MTLVQGSVAGWWQPRWNKDTMVHFSRSGFLLVCVTVILMLTLLLVLRLMGVHLNVVISGTYVAGHYSLVLINCPTEDAAKVISRHIMEKRMAACVNILPHTSTMYYWKGEIQEAPEILLLVRTKTSHIQRLINYVTTIHPYEIPEILSFPAEDGYLPYLKWMDEAVSDI